MSHADLDYPRSTPRRTPAPFAEGADRVLRAVSIWGAMAAAERRGFNSGWYTGANDMRRMLRDTRMVWAEVSR